MDQRKGSGSDANGGLAEATASRLRFEDPDEVMEENPAAAAATVGAEEEGGEGGGGEEVIGSDKTSADYYFDSYSHFGKRRSRSIRFLGDAVLFHRFSFLGDDNAN